jgi:hypothetical protein
VTSKTNNFAMVGLVPAIHDFVAAELHKQDVDVGHRAGHDAEYVTTLA